MFSKPVLNRCVPTNIYALGKDVVQSVYAYLNSFDLIKQTGNYVKQSAYSTITFAPVGDIMTSWQEILMMAGWALLISFILVFFIHHMAAFVSWIILIFVSVSMCVVTGVLWWTYIDMKYKLNYVALFDRLDENVRNEKTFLVLSIISSVVTLVMLLIVLVMRKRVKLVTAQQLALCISYKLGYRSWHCSTKPPIASAPCPDFCSSHCGH